MTDRDRIERWQRIARAALAKMETLRLGDLDESFYEALRDALVTAGATDGEIDGTAAGMVTLVVEATPPGSGLREEQFDLITTHLARTAMKISIAKDDNLLSVEFPDRPKVQ